MTAPGRPALTLLIADEEAADTFWRLDSASGPVLVRGPQLARTARPHGAVLALTGDTAAASGLEVWGLPQTRAITWNGAPVAVRSTKSGSLSSVRDLAGPKPIALPDLTAGPWKYAAESPEAAAGFDDAAWRTADLTSTNSTTKPPAGQVVLTADDYGFHHGDVWYRGHFTGPAPESVSLDFGGGGAGLLQAWLDGTYLGQYVLPTAVSSPPTRGSTTFTIPESQRGDGDHVLSVMVRNDSHNEDGGVNDAHKEGRGLIGVTGRPGA